jgi:hypothetical protein
MVFDINRFVSKVASVDGLAQSNKFLVTFTTPGILTVDTVKKAKTDFIRTSVGLYDDFQTQQTLSLFCDAASLPGVGIMTDEVRPYGIGPQQKIPYNTVFQDIALSLYADNKGYVHRYFTNWASKITNTTKRDKSYLMAYKDEISTDVKITTYDQTENKVIIVTLKDAFLTSLIDTPLAWNDSSIKRIPINLSFTSWETQYKKVIVDNIKENIKNLNEILHIFPGAQSPADDTLFGAFGLENGVNRVASDIFNQFPDTTLSQITGLLNIYGDDIVRII